jgi:hypothetical protein
MLVYEDNFGFWDIGGAEERAFFHNIQRQSVLIACERCESPVRLIPPKEVCASCVSALEYGAPISMKEYGCSQKQLLALLIRRKKRFLPEFRSFVRGEAIAKMSEFRLKGVRRIA